MDINLTDLGPLALAVINIATSVFAAGHAILTKSDVRAATGWVGLILLVPFVGWIIYLLFGINRIERRARELRGIGHEKSLEKAQEKKQLPSPSGLAGLIAAPGQDTAALHQLAQLGQQVAPGDLAPGNRVTLMENGDQAYPEMLAAIDGAQTSIALATYIFNHDKAGLQFLDALERAKNRGVRVRVLIDGVGSWYSRPSLFRLLQERAIPCDRFLHSFLPWEMPYLNMRNHHKILVVDGKLGFTGSMNIAEGNLHKLAPSKPITDHHFKVEGPVVRQLMETFAGEWNFTTSEILMGPDWFPELEPKGSVIARGIAAGPDLGQNPIRWTLLAALSQAREHIRIVTPYFLPDVTLRTALSLAAMRGVTVDILMPQTNNLVFVKWAASPQFAELAAAGCRLWMVPGPFVHSKLMTIDNAWSLIGSANWDTRSLRLNFEFNMECYGSALAATINHVIDQKQQTARRITIDQLAGRSMLVRLRDGVIRLFSPYL